METYSYLFSGGQTLNNPAVIEFVRATIPFPVPYVSFVGRSGQFNIKFTRNIALEENLKELQGDDDDYELSDYVREIVEKQHIVLSIGPKGFLGKADSTQGTPSFTEEQFKSSRRLRKSSLNFRGLSGESSNDWIKEEEMEQLKEFNWTLVEMRKDSMTIKVEFESSGIISYDEIDQLIVEFPNPSFLRGETSPDTIPSEFLLKVNIPRQIDPEYEDLLTEGAKTATLAMQVVTLTNVAIAVATQGSLQHVGSSISSLQMIIHLPMYNVTLPANAMIVFENLINIVTFDIISFKEDLGVSLIDTSPTLAFNEKFEMLGYDSQNTIDLLGSINLLIMWVLA